VVLRMHLEEAEWLRRGEDVEKMRGLETDASARREIEQDRHGIFRMSSTHCARRVSRPPLYLSPLQGERSARLPSALLVAIVVLPVAIVVLRVAIVVLLVAIVVVLAAIVISLVAIGPRRSSFLPLKGGGSRWGSRAARAMSEFVPSR